MKFNRIFIGILTFLMPLTISAQKNANRGEMDFPELVFATIKGAPKLSKPFMVMGSTQPLLTKKHGLIAPALWDWNKDGKQDLLLGEFQTGDGPNDSNVRVYLNVGTDAKPKFTDTYSYAKDTEGNRLQVFQWCCIGFTPMFYDLNNDGYKDIITGQYHPGDITWFKGSEKGFLPGIKLVQEGNPDSNKKGVPFNDIRSFSYWNYSSASMGDFDGDGDYDLIVGGSDIRISENIGTKTHPKFAKRKLLLTVDGKPLKNRRISQKEVDEMNKWYSSSASGGIKTQQFVVDWDNDGVLDILSTDAYLDNRSMAIAFFKGVNTKEGIRFHQGIDLIKAKDGSKALPGTGNRIYIDDWNKDGIKDLIVGASIVTVRDKFHGEYSWTWEKETGIESAGKDAGEPPHKKPESTFAMYKKRRNEFNKANGRKALSDELLKKLYKNAKKWYNTKIKEQSDPNTPDNKVYRHQGRVYVFLGKK